MRHPSVRRRTRSTWQAWPRKTCWPETYNSRSGMKSPRSTPRRRFCSTCPAGRARAKEFIPGSIHIPLDEIRSRISELPRDREIIAY